MSPPQGADAQQKIRLSWGLPHTLSVQEALASLVVLVSTILLEILPILAWMLVFSAANNSLRHLPLPPWWLGVVVLASWSLSVTFRRFGGSPSGNQRRELLIRLVTVVGWIVTVVLSLLLSPGAYAGMPLQQVIATIVSDLTTGANRLVVDVGLAILVAYLWWRGLLLGRLPLTRDRLYTRAVWGGVAILASLILLNNIPGPDRAQATTLLALLLPGYIFIGLTGVALAHLIDTSREHKRRQQRAVSVTGEAVRAATGQPQTFVSRAWIISALGLSTAIVGGALILGLLLSYHSVQALAQLLHPVADAFGAVLTWLIYALAYILFLLLNPLITWLHNLIAQHEKGGQTTTSQPPTRHLPNTSTHTIPPNWLLVGRIAVVVVLVLIVVLVFWWVLRRFAAVHRSEEFEEQREALSASEVLGAQLRSLLAGLRRPRAAPPGHDPLVPESVRYLYRAVLERASSVGLGRELAETPDEYAQRLQILLQSDPAAEPISERALAGPGTQLTPGVGAQQIHEGLEALTSAYDQARYGFRPEDRGKPDAPAPPRLRASMSTIVDWFNTKSRAVRARGTGPRFLGRRQHQTDR